MTKLSYATSSHHSAPDTSPMELSALEDHLGHCRGTNGRLYALGCLAERMNGYVTPRFFTTLVVIGLLIGTGSLFS